LVIDLFVLGFNTPVENEIPFLDGFFQGDFVGIVATAVSDACGE
jgi:hypothetical protein